MYNIILADDTKTFRDAMLRAFEAFQFEANVYEAENGQEVLDLIEAQPHHYHLVFLDLQMPVLSGFHALKVISKTYPQVKVLCQSFYFDNQNVMASFALGARGFVTKDDDTQDFFDAMKIVLDGGIYYSSKIDEKLFQLLNIAEAGLNTHTKEISKSEIEVLKLICKGHSYTTISSMLNISENTVNAHRKNIFTKTNTKNIPELVSHAIINGLYIVK